LLELLPKLLTSEPSFVIISCHDDDWSAIKLQEQLLHVLGPTLSATGKCTSGHLVLQATKLPDQELVGNSIAMGTAVRWLRKYT
jgi:hypothetical protein